MSPKLIVLILALLLGLREGAWGGGNELIIRVGGESDK